MLTMLRRRLLPSLRSASWRRSVGDVDRTPRHSHMLKHVCRAACGVSSSTPSLTRAALGRRSSSQQPATEGGPHAEPSDEVSLLHSSGLLVTGVALGCGLAMAVLYAKGKSPAGPKQILEKAVEDVFHRIDSDESGTISTQELHLAVVMLSTELNARIPYSTVAPPQSRTREALIKFDVNNDGVLDKAEFTALMMSLLDVADAYFLGLSSALIRNVVLLPLLAYGAKACLMQIRLLKPAVSLVPVSVVAPIIGVSMTLAHIQTHTPVMLLHDDTKMRSRQ